MKRVEVARRTWGRWILLGVSSCAWIGMILLVYFNGRGGISLLTRDFSPSGSLRPSEKADLWAEAFMAGADSGWEWMIANPIEMKNIDNTGHSVGPKEKLRGHARDSVSSAWLDSVPGLLPLRRKVHSDGTVVAELLASTGYQTRAELMENLAGMCDGTIGFVAVDKWRATVGGIPLVCQWQDATGAVSETKSGQMRGWLLVRPGIEESSRP